MSGGGLPQFSQEEIMSNLLSASEERDDQEPEIAANITQQMLHMELEPLPRSMRSRFRDVVERLAPKNFIEVGAGIGNLSACLLYTSPSPRDRQKSRMPSSA